MVEVVKVGIKCHPPSLIVKYKLLNKTKLHKINIKGVYDNEPINGLLTKIFQKEHHLEFLHQIPKVQLMRLITVLRDLKNGITLEESLGKNNAIETISSMEDLNKADDEVIIR